MCVKKSAKPTSPLKLTRATRFTLGASMSSAIARPADKVVRREIKVHEGELYNETRKRESVENVQRLGFFEDVTFNT